MARVPDAPMVELTLHGRAVKTVFDLLDARARTTSPTHSAGDSRAARPPARCWARPSAPTRPRSRSLPSDYRSRRPAPGAPTSRSRPSASLVIEAKRGWTLPLPSQLAKYTERLLTRDRHIAVVAECAADYPPVTALLGAGGGVPVSYIPWARVAELVQIAACAARSHAERRLLAELHRYLLEVMTMQDVRSNMVYVVSLSTREIAGSSGLSTVMRSSSPFARSLREGCGKR